MALLVSHQVIPRLTRHVRLCSPKAVASHYDTYCIGQYTPVVLTFLVHREQAIALLSNYNLRCLLFYSLQTVAPPGRHIVELLYS